MKATRSWPVPIVGKERVTVGLDLRRERTGRLLFTPTGPKINHIEYQLLKIIRPRLRSSA
jgi:hypothetical protein